MSFPNPAFWANFRERHWEKESLLLRRPFGALFVEPTDIFEILVRACDRYRAGESVRLRLFGEHGLVSADLHRLIPQPSDGCFAGYERRITKELSSPSFTLVVNYLHTHDHDLWNKARGFLAGLVAQVGLPAAYADVDLFVSSKRLTAFGIHQDTASNFTLVLEGRKKMRLWPPEFFKHRPPMDEESYAEHVQHALTLEGEAGDLLYWPSSAWHVAESAGDLSVAMNISLYLDNPESSCSPAIDLVCQRARDLVIRRLGSPATSSTYPLRPGSLQASGERMPEPISLVVDAFQAIARDDVLEQEMTALWLNRVTACGFSRVPPSRSSPPLHDRNEVWLDPRFPVLWRQVKDGRIVVSADGRGLFLPRGRGDVIRMIEILNTGRRVRVGKLLRELSENGSDAGEGRDGSREYLRGLLQSLYGWRCLDKMEAPSSGEASA